MQELTAQWAAAQIISKHEAREVKELENQGVQKVPLHVTRLEMLARDIRHMVSHDQRCKILQTLEAEKAKKVKEAEELKLAEDKLTKQISAKTEAAKAKKESQASQALIEIEEVKHEMPEEEDKRPDLIDAEADWVDDDDDSRSLKSDLTVGDHALPQLHKRDPGSIDDERSVPSDGSDDESIDFDNLPEDRVERFELLGIDPKVLDGGEEDLIIIYESSAIEELTRKQEMRRIERARKEKEKKMAADAQ